MPGILNNLQPYATSGLIPPLGAKVQVNGSTTCHPGSVPDESEDRCGVKVAAAR